MEKWSGSPTKQELSDGHNLSNGRVLKIGRILTAIFCDPLSNRSKILHILYGEWYCLDPQVS